MVPTVPGLCPDRVGARPHSHLRPDLVLTTTCYRACRVLLDNVDDIDSAAQLQGADKGAAHRDILLLAADTDSSAENQWQRLADGGRGTDGYQCRAEPGDSGRGGFICELAVLPDISAYTDTSKAGKLYLIAPYLAFASLDRKSVRFTLPLSTVRRVERLNARAGIYALSLALWDGGKIVRLPVGDGLHILTVHRLCN